MNEERRTVRIKTRRSPTDMFRGRPDIDRAQLERQVLELAELPIEPGDSEQERQAKEQANRIVQRFAQAALAQNLVNLQRTEDELRRSYDDAHIAHQVTFAIGVLTAVAAVLSALGAFGADSEFGPTAVLGGLSASTFIFTFFYKPAQAMERNGILLAWLRIVLNTYWTRLVYQDDADKAQEELQAAAKDASDSIATIFDKHAAAVAGDIAALKDLGDGETESEAGTDDENGEGAAKADEAGQVGASDSGEGKADQPGPTG